MRKIVWVEYIGGQISKIFKNQKQAIAQCDNPQVCFKDIAVGAIRHQVYERQNGKCRDCGIWRPYDGNVFERFHMDEIVPKSEGGLVSLENTQGLCFDCHIVKKHNRQPRWSSQNEHSKI